VSGGKDEDEVCLRAIIDTHSDHHHHKKLDYTQDGSSGTQPEQKLRLKGKGAPKLGTDIRGDAFITVKVKIPQNVSGKEKELVEQLSEVVEKNKKTGGFFGGF
jgi:DnaJ-class molecular chaperone